MKQRRESGNKKAEYPRITLRPRPDQEPAKHNANRSARQDYAVKKRYNLAGHNSPVVLGKRHFLLGRFWSYLP